MPRLFAPSPTLAFFLHRTGSVCKPGSASIQNTSGSRVGCGKLKQLQDLRPEDVDMRQSIVEAEQLLTQARSRVKTLEAPFPIDVDATKELPKVLSPHSFLPYLPF